MSNRVSAKKQNTEQFAGILSEFIEAMQAYEIAVPEIQNSTDHQTKADDIILRFKKLIIEVVQHSARHCERAARSREEFIYCIGFLEGLVDTTDPLILLSKPRQTLENKLRSLLDAFDDTALMADLSYQQLQKHFGLTSEHATGTVGTLIPHHPSILAGGDNTDQLARLLINCSHVTGDYITFGTRAKDEQHLEYLRNLKDPEPVDDLKAFERLKNHNMHIRHVYQGHYLRKTKVELGCFCVAVTEIVRNASTHPEEAARSKEKLARRVGYIAGLAYTKEPNPYSDAFDETIGLIEAATHSTTFIQSVSYLDLKEKIVTVLNDNSSSHSMPPTPLDAARPILANRPDRIIQGTTHG